jgi:hypothetical protein
MTRQLGRVDGWQTLDADFDITFVTVQRFDHAIDKSGFTSTASTIHKKYITTGFINKPC